MYERRVAPTYVNQLARRMNTSEPRQARPNRSAAQQTVAETEAKQQLESRASVCDDLAGGGEGGREGGFPPDKWRGKAGGVITGVEARHGGDGGEGGKGIPASSSSW